MKNIRRILFVLLAFVLLAGPAWAGDVKNLIWVIGDGMGPEAIGFFTQGVRYANLPDYPEKTSHLERMLNGGTWGMFFNNTYDTLVTDSAAAATQMATGKFSRPGVIGEDYNGVTAKTLLEMAREKGMSVGVVTDAYVTDATPAAFTAHTQNRRQKMDIARQMIAFGPEVIMGGGLKYFSTGENKKLLKQAKKKGYHIATDKKELSKIKSGKVLGLFAEQALPMTVEMYMQPQIPTLTEQTQKAVEILSQNPNGFILMVEAGKIDWAAHGNDAGAWFKEMQNLDTLLGYVLGYADKTPDTLVYLNADHDTGVGAFTYRHLGQQKVMEKTAQGEVLYDGDVDYASFKTYHQFLLQKRSLYNLKEELKKLPAATLTPAFLQGQLTAALGYPVDISGFKNPADLDGLFKQLDEERGIVWATPSHSSLPLLSVAYGEEADEFSGLYHNTEILPRMKAALGW